jgi:hypothetical protein
VSFLFRIFALAVILSLTACGDKELPTYQEQGYVFGTLVEVSVYGEEDAHARKAVVSVMQEFQRLHDLLHAWKPSTLSDMNNAFAKGKSSEVTPELAAMLKDAAQLSAQSDGLFNPAIGGLIKLWGFQADEYKPVLPDEKQLAALIAAKPQMSDLVFTSTTNPFQPPLISGKVDGPPLTAKGSLQSSGEPTGGVNSVQPKVGNGLPTFGVLRAGARETEGVLFLVFHRDKGQTQTPPSLLLSGEGQNEQEPKNLISSTTPGYPSRKRFAAIISATG